MSELYPFCTFALIALTVAVSYKGFTLYGLEEKYIFNPQAILAGGQYYRLITPAFLHADWRHLGLNMLTLFLFGRLIEDAFGHWQFLAIYFGAILGGSLLSLYVHRNHDYHAYGASGGVCGVVFAYVLLAPFSHITMFYVPLPIPAWLYAIAYMAASFYGMKEHNRGNIGHDAHLGGGILGFLITAALQPELVQLYPQIFLLILIPSVLLLLYLWRNPLFLPVRALAAKPKKNQRSSPRSYREETAQMDAILEKISISGMDSLTETERATLDELSGRFKRRGESNKPTTGLSI